MAEHCGGCGGGDIYLTEKALELLELLGERAFLPLGERGGKPVYISDSGEVYVSSPTALKLSGLATLDLDIPLQGFDYSGYAGCTRLGSMALTARGQEALESLSIRGVEE